MDVSMSSRQNQILDLELFLKSVDTEVTMILQSLQWDRKHLTEKKAMVICQYNSHHRVPPNKLLEHEHSCFLKSQGYTKSDRLLPSPVDPNVATLVKFDSDNIAEIINNASRSELGFKRVLVPLAVTDYILLGAGCSGTQPLTLERLQVTYTADERRAIHDAVVNQVPSCHDLSDLALLSANNENSKDIKPKSKLEILAELRDMKRRRTKYRVASKSRNYSDVLRDVINTQMELYNQAQNNLNVEIKKEPSDNNERDEISSKDNISVSQDYDRPKEKKDSNDGHSSRKDRSKYRESHYSRHNEEHERRKRRFEYEDVTPSKYLKTERYEKSNAHKNYKSSKEDWESDSTKHADSRPNNRDKRDMEVSTNRERRKHYDDDREKYKNRHEKDNSSRNKVHTGHNLSEKHTGDPKDAANISKNGSSMSRDGERYYSDTVHSSDVQRRRDKDRHENFNKSNYEHNYEYGEVKNKKREKDDSFFGSEDKEGFKISKKHKRHKRRKHKYHSYSEEKDSTKKKHKDRTNDSEDSELDRPHRSKNMDHINLETKIKYEEKSRPYDTIYEGERHKRKKDEESKRDSTQRTKDNETFYSDSRAEGKSNDHRKYFRDKYNSSDERQTEVHFSDSRKYERGTDRKDKESYK